MFLKVLPHSPCDGSSYLQGMNDKHCNLPVKPKIIYKISRESSVNSSTFLLMFIFETTFLQWQIKERKSTYASNSLSPFLCPRKIPQNKKIIMIVSFEELTLETERLFNCVFLPSKYFVCLIRISLN